MPTQNNLSNAIKKLESFIEADSRESLHSLLCTFILIRVVLDEKKMSNPKLYKFSTKYITKIAAGANNWEGLTQEFLDEVRSIANEVADAYMEAFNENKIHFREFIKNIGASGMGDPLGPEGRGDLSQGLLIFAELANRFDTEIENAISNDFMEIIVNHLDCEDIIGELRDVANHFVNQIEDYYEGYSAE